MSKVKLSLLRVSLKTEEEIMEMFFTVVYVVSMLIVTAALTFKKNSWKEIEATYIANYNESAKAKGKPEADEHLKGFMFFCAFSTAVIIAVMPVLNTFITVRATANYIRKRM